MRWKTPQKENNPNDQRLLSACREGKVSVVQECLQTNVNVNYMEDGWMPLHLACAHRHQQVAELLLEAEANPDLIAKANGFTPLSILIQGSNSSDDQSSSSEQVVLHMVEALLRYGADPSGCADIQTESSPLHMAAQHGRLELVQLLIEYGALMIHGQTRSLQHPLHHHCTANTSMNALTTSIASKAARMGGTRTVDTVKTFTSNNYNHKTNLTPLAMACQAGHVMVMDYLLSALPPQTLESSLVLQQALQEARFNRNVECLVGLWEYSEDVLWLDYGKEGSIDPARHAGLVQSFFDIFQESSTLPQQEDLHASFRGTEDSKPSAEKNAAASWWEVLQEACRRKSVNLMQSLLQRLPHQDDLFNEIRHHNQAMRVALLQAVDRHDHQTLLHRFCAAGETTSPDPVVVAWIQRLLQLSRECCEVDLEEMRLANLANQTIVSKLNRSFVANYDDSKFTLETSDFSLDSSQDGGEANSTADDVSEEGSEGDSSSNDDSSSEETFGSEVQSSFADQRTRSEEFSVRFATEPHYSELPHSGNFEESDEESSEEEEGSGSEESYSLESETESETTEHGFRSDSSSAEEQDTASSPDLYASFANLPSHSGKDLVNAVDVNLQTALHIACARGFLQAIHLLLAEENIMVNAQDLNGNTPLMVSQHADVISCLMLDPRTDLNVTNCDGLTRLHLAIHQGDMFMLQLLLDKGADSEMRDAHGRSPLYLACEEGNTEFCVYLLAHGANPNATTWQQRDTPLHAACQGGHLGVILRLFAADVHVVDANGRTPLHIACFFGHAGVVEYLITERGASLNAQDNDGLTPFELACQEGCVNVVYYLVRYRTSNMWNRTSHSFLRPLRSLSLEEEFSCSYSNISTCNMLSYCYSKEDPFSISCAYKLDPNKKDHESYSTVRTFASNYPHEDEKQPHSSGLYDVSHCTSSHQNEAFEISPRYRRLLYDDLPIYY